LASELLTPLGDRWQHVPAVAAAAREVSAAVEPAERELPVSAAWLHDIGYAPSIGHLRFHPVDGARFLAGQDASERLCALVAHHSCGPVRG